MAEAVPMVTFYVPGQEAQIEKLKQEGWQEVDQYPVAGHTAVVLGAPERRFRTS